MHAVSLLAKKVQALHLNVDHSVYVNVTDCDSDHCYIFSESGGSGRVQMVMRAI